MKNNKIKANILILLTVFFWGISATNTKIVLEEVPPGTLAFIRFSLATVLLWSINRKINPEMRLEKKDRKRMMFCGVTGISLYFILETYGISLISAANATILLASIPIFTMLGERVFLKRPIKKAESLGAVITLAGVGLVIGNSLRISGGYREIIGSMLLIGAALSWVVFSLANKTLENKYSILFNSTYQSLYGSLVLLPVALMEYRSWGPISMVSWGNILYLTLFCSALCTFMYLSALKELGATVTNVYINLMPFVGVLAAAIVLKETLYPLQILGGIVIVLGISLANVKSLWINSLAKGKKVLTQKS
ncbi:DMT family transporter [Isachenkonia alkalipeptolytica]|nr:DMT family transporter [Isachenkonia alkalipeptolytica]